MIDISIRQMYDGMLCQTCLRCSTQSSEQSIIHLLSCIHLWLGFGTYQVFPVFSCRCNIPIQIHSVHTFIYTLIATPHSTRRLHHPLSPKREYLIFWVVSWWGELSSQNAITYHKFRPIPSITYILFPFGGRWLVEASFGDVNTVSLIAVNSKGKLEQHLYQVVQ